MGQETQAVTLLTKANYKIITQIFGCKHHHLKTDFLTQLQPTVL